MSVVTPTLLSGPKGGPLKEIDILYEVTAIDIRREVNRVPRASLVLLDGDATKGVFDLSNSEFFKPGKELEIKLRYESQGSDVSVFKGIAPMFCLNLGTRVLKAVSRAACTLARA